MKIFQAVSILALLIGPVLCSGQNRPLKPVALEIDRIMQARSKAGEFNGSVLVARQGQILYQRGFGLANMEWNIPNEVNTKFEIASMTKQFTALLVLQFVNEGKIKLDGHLSDYLPYYRKDTGSRITIAELLSHTSGIPNFLSFPGFIDGPPSRTHYGVMEFVKKYCSNNLQSEPGTKFDYGNSGYFLLGAVLEQISGNSYEQLLRDRIFTPLGMKDSGYFHSETVIPRLASGYERKAEGFQNARYYDTSIPFAAGGMYSTVDDLYLWDQALYGERLLPARLRDLLFKPNLENYGYGWNILIPKAGSPYAGEAIAMHTGLVFGFQCVIARIPKHQELIVLLDNAEDATLLGIGLQIQQALYKNP